MLKIVDIFPVVGMYSVTLNGDFTKIRNGVILKSDSGEAFSVESVAMVNHVEKESRPEVTILCSTKPPPIGTEVGFV